MIYYEDAKEIQWEKIIFSINGAGTIRKLYEKKGVEGGREESRKEGWEGERKGGKSNHFLIIFSNHIQNFPSFFQTMYV